MKHTTYARAQANLEELLDEVVENSEPVIIRRGKGRNVAVISTKELRGLLETIHLLRIAQQRKAAARFIGTITPWRGNVGDRSATARRVRTRARQVVGAPKAQRC